MGRRGWYFFIMAGLLWNARAGAVDVPGRDPRETFARGNRYYEEGDYEAALNEYKQLVEADYAGANIFYNLGNAAFKLDRLGEAILYYHKALLMHPRDQDIRSNLEYADSLIEDKIEPAPAIWVVRKWRGLVHYYSFHEFLLAVIFLYWCVCIAIVAALYVPGLRRVIARGVSIAVFILIVIACAAFHRQVYENNERVVLLSGEAKARYGPSENDVVAFVLHEGAVVDLENSRGEWYQIQLPDGKSGWVKKESCGVI